MLDAEVNFPGMVFVLAVITGIFQRACVRRMVPPCMKVVIGQGDTPGTVSGFPDSQVLAQEDQASQQEIKQEKSCNGFLYRKFHK